LLGMVRLPHTSLGPASCWFSLSPPGIARCSLASGFPFFVSLSLVFAFPPIPLFPGWPQMSCVSLSFVFLRRFCGVPLGLVFSGGSAYLLFFAPVEVPFSPDSVFSFSRFSLTRRLSSKTTLSFSSIPPPLATFWESMPPCA